MRTLLLLALLTGCAQQGLGYNKPTDDSAPVDTQDTAGHDTAPVDTADTDGDLDDDGFTPEEGDCDDNDIHVAPGRRESADGKDNDCDGRIDEEWSGFDIAYSNDDGSSEILTIDTIGREADWVTVHDGCYPTWLDHAAGPLSDGTDGWVINNGYAKVSTVARDGTCTDLFDFSEDTDTYPFGVYGIATGLDGTIYATTLDGLQAVSPDGTVTEVASWSCNFDDPSAHELAAYTLAVDPLTGQVGLFGYFGGFATYDPGTGTFTLLVTEDLENATLSLSSGAHKDGGGWYAAGSDSAAGTNGFYRFNADSAAWEQKQPWTDEDWLPDTLAIDGDSGDYYVTANAGWYYTLWRVVGTSGEASQMYSTDGTEAHRGFHGIVTDY